MTMRGSRRVSKHMKWVIFVAGAVLSRGTYGTLLYKGQMQFGNPPALWQGPASENGRCVNSGGR